MKELEEVDAQAKSPFPWYADIINYLVVSVLPTDPIYQKKKEKFHDLK